MNATLIIQLADKAKANELAKGLDSFGTDAGNTFKNCQLSASGALPVTHLACNAWVSEEMADAIRLLLVQVPSAVCAFDAVPLDVIAANNLKVIVNNY